MTDRLIRDGRAAAVTVVPDRFIDTYLPIANGDFVKIYLYLLRSAHRADAPATLAQLADVFSCTESDIRRALRYWQKEGLLELTFSGKELEGIALLDDRAPAPAEGGAEAPKASPAPRATAASTQVSTTRARELRERKEVQDILYMAETYKGSPLEPTYIRTLLYFYDDLQFPADLVEYLVEYCVERGKNTTAYLRTVGLAWHEEGLTDLRAAKASVKARTAADKKAGSPAATKNKFNNFTQRMNDYDQLQKELARAQRKKK